MRKHVANLAGMMLSAVLQEYVLRMRWAVLRCTQNWPAAFGKSCLDPRGWVMFYCGITTTMLWRKICEYSWWNLTSAKNPCAWPSPFLCWCKEADRQIRINLNETKICKHWFTGVGQTGTHGYHPLPSAQHQESAFCLAAIKLPSLWLCQALESRSSRW